MIVGLGLYLKYLFEGRAKWYGWSMFMLKDVLAVSVLGTVTSVGYGLSLAKQITMYELVALLVVTLHTLFCLFAQTGN